MTDWLYYNYADGSFRTKNFVAEFIRLKLNFIFKNQIAFQPHFGDLGGYVRTQSVACCKARGRLSKIFVIIELFAVSYGLDVRPISENLSTIGVF